MVPRCLHIGGGRLSVGPKLKPGCLPDSVGVVVTLIQDSEGAAAIGRALEGVVVWKHLPFSTRKLRDVLPVEFTYALEQLMIDLWNGSHVHVHCLEGLHRTGIFTYGLLRMMGCDQFDAMDVLSMLRPESARALTTPLREWTETTIRKGFRQGWSGRLKN